MTKITSLSVALAAAVALTGPAVSSQDVSIRVEGSTVLLDNAEVVATDIMASNGVINVTDSVILPK